MISRDELLTWKARHAQTMYERIASLEAQIAVLKARPIGTEVEELAQILETAVPKVYIGEGQYRDVGPEAATLLRRLAPRQSEGWRATQDALATLHSEEYITEATLAAAIQWFDALQSWPAPKIFAHGGDSIVFKWDDRLFLTITAEGVSLYHGPSNLLALPAPPESQP